MGKTRYTFALILALICLQLQAIAQNSPDGQKTIILDRAPAPLNLEKVQASIGYPAEARDNQLAGTVIVLVLVDENGKVADHKVVEDPHPVLTEAVVKHINDLEFEPALVEKKPFKCWFELPFEFKLPERTYFFLEEALADAKNVKRLHLSERGLKVFPPEILQLPNLESLDLGDNQIKEIPALILSLKKLKWLNLDRNFINSGVEILGQMPELETLQIRENTIPKSDHKRIKRKLKGIKVLI